MEGARSILLSITGGRDLSLWEVNEAAKAVSEAAHPDANIIFGAMVDEKLEDQVWVTVVATGYEQERRAGPPGADAWRSPRASHACSAPRRRAARRVASAAAARGRRARRAGVHAARLKGPSLALGFADEQRSTRSGRRRSSADRGGGSAGAARRRQRGGRGGGGDAHVVRGGAAADGPGGGGLPAGRRRAGWEPTLLDFFVEAPARARDGSAAELQAIDVSFGDAVQVFHIGPASCGVYGTPAGVCEAIARWGTVALAELAAPAARLARAGVALNAGQAYVAEILAELLLSTEECAALWAPAGSVLREGEVLRNPELGDTLERLGREGAGPFYAGDIAAAVSEWLEARGGSITARGARVLPARGCARRCGWATATGCC